MQILAIETSTLTGSIALVSGGNVLGEVTLSVSVQHSERLMPAIEELLRDASVLPKEIDLYTVSAGPGSFTGLRIGMAAAQGLALAYGKPVVGVSTLEGLAMNGLYFPGLVVPMLNAFRSEIYWGVYRSDGSGMEEVTVDRVSVPGALIDHLKGFSEKILVTGNGLDVCGPLILQELGEERVQLAPPALRLPRAVHLASLAEKRLKSGVSMEAALPRYLRKPG
jgi:tRNA threonylcarbamoyladenosine biosynthesis protein TsaB